MKRDIVICILLFKEWSSSIEKNSLSHLVIETLQMNPGNQQATDVAARWLITWRLLIVFRWLYFFKSVL